MSARWHLVLQVVVDCEWELEDQNYSDFDDFMSQAKTSMKRALTGEGACRDGSCANCQGILREVVDVFAFRHRIKSDRWDAVLTADDRIDFRATMTTS